MDNGDYITDDPIPSLVAVDLLLDHDNRSLYLTDLYKNIISIIIINGDILHPLIINE